MAFLDKTILNVTAGRGGDGVVRWRRESGIPMGGPAGGDGGQGGDVYAVGIRNLHTLHDYRHQKDFAAEDGGAGGGSGSAATTSSTTSSTNSGTHVAARPAIKAVPDSRTTSSLKDLFADDKADPLDDDEFDVPSFLK